MSHVSPVFTDYEQQVVRELALHRVQPNAIQRLLEGAGKPMAKLMNLGRNSQSRALRGIADHVHGWIEEGLIKTFRVANRLANTKDISKRYAARGIQIGEDFDSLRFMPLSQLDAVADSCRWRSPWRRNHHGRGNSRRTTCDSLTHPDRCDFLHDSLVTSHVPYCDGLW